jgi:hypothetical protein
VASSPKQLLVSRKVNAIRQCLQALMQLLQPTGSLDLEIRSRSGHESTRSNMSEQRGSWIEF